MTTLRRVAIHFSFPAARSCQSTLSLHAQPKPATWTTVLHKWTAATSSFSLPRPDFRWDIYERVVKQDDHADGTDLFPTTGATE